MHGSLAWLNLNLYIHNYTQIEYRVYILNLKNISLSIYIRSHLITIKNINPIIFNNTSLYLYLTR